MVETETVLFSQLSTKNSQPLQKPGARIFDRSTSFAVATALCRRDLKRPVSPGRPRKNFFAKRRMRAGRCAFIRQLPDERQTSPTLELEETCYANSPNMFCLVEFE